MNRQPAVIFDRDGTLAAVDRRFVVNTDPDETLAWQFKKDWEGFNASLPFDAVVPEVAALFRAIRPGITKIITTGRTDNLRPQMSDWLHKHDLTPDLLLMRRTGDQRIDSTVKREIFETQIAPRFDVLYVVDDRPQVCDMWRSLGLPLLQVVQPDVVELFPSFPAGQ